MLCEAGGFQSARGNRFCSLHCYLLSSLEALSRPQPQVICSCVCTGLYSVEYSVGGYLCSPSVFSLHTFLSILCPANSIHLSLLGSQLRVRWAPVLPLSPLPISVIIHFIAWGPLCWKLLFYIYFVHSWFPGSKVNLVPFVPSQLKSTMINVPNKHHIFREFLIMTDNSYRIVLNF